MHTGIIYTVQLLNTPLLNTPLVPYKTQLTLNPPPTRFGKITMSDHSTYHLKLSFSQNVNVSRFMLLFTAFKNIMFRQTKSSGFLVILPAGDPSAALSRTAVPLFLTK